jgi:hypothetical protein
VAFAGQLALLALFVASFAFDQPYRREQLPFRSDNSEAAAQGLMLGTARAHTNIGMWLDVQIVTSTKQGESSELLIKRKWKSPKA